MNLHLVCRTYQVLMNVAPHPGEPDTAISLNISYFSFIRLNSRFSSASTDVVSSSIFFPTFRSLNRTYTHEWTDMTTKMATSVMKTAPESGICSEDDEENTEQTIGTAHTPTMKHNRLVKKTSIH